MREQSSGTKLCCRGPAARDEPEPDSAVGSVPCIGPGFGFGLWVRAVSSGFGFGRWPQSRSSLGKHVNRRILTFCAAACLVALTWLGTMTTRESPAYEASPPASLSDFWLYYRPNAERAFARLAEGDLPLWDERQSLGAPFLATAQTGVLYPPNWLHMRMPAQAAFHWLAAAHLALASVLTGALAGALGAGLLGSAFAGIITALSTYFCAAVWTPPVLYSAAWIPGVLLGVDAVIRRPSARRVAALACAIGLQALAGWPFVLLMTGLLALLFGAAALLERGLQESRVPTHALPGLAAAALLGFALAAPQLLPTQELAARSPRAPGLLPAAQAIFLPGPHDPGRFLARLVERGVNDGVPGLGALALALLAICLPGPSRLRCAALLFAAGLAILVSFADHTPLYGLLRKLPLASDFRFPMRYRLLSTVAIGVCAGVGLGRTWALLRARSRGVAWALATIAVAAALLQVSAVAANQVPFARREAMAPPDLPLRSLEAAAKQRPALSRALFDGRSARERASVVVHLVNDLEPLSLSATARVFNFLARGEADTLCLSAASSTNAPYYGLVSLPVDGERTALLDLLGIRLVASEAPPDWLAQRFPVAATVGGRAFVFENPNALPRAYRVSRAEATPRDPQAALERLVSPDFDPRQVVMLDPPPAPGAAAAEPEPAASVQIDAYEPERVRLTTHGERPGYVVLADAFDADWTTSIDGAPAPLVRANTALRAVRVESGSHEIEFLYQPRRFRLGATLSLTALCFVLAMLLWTFFFRSHPDSSRG